MSGIADALTEMGFPRNRVDKAISKTNNQSLEAAMEWLLQHSEDADIDEPFEALKGNVLQSSAEASTAAEGEQAAVGADSSEDAASTADPGQVHSFKCDDCGKLLRSDVDVQAHATRTNHSNFSESTEEIKPLTAEQKAEQLAKLQERMKKNREAREAKEKAEAKERERIRRTQGKDIGMAKFEMEQKELRQLAEQKRKEKAEERAAKQRVLDQIQKDKEARAAAAAASSSTSSQSLNKSASQSATTVQPSQVTQPVEKKEYSECRLQIRLPSGQPVTQTFKANESLAAVRLFVSVSNPDISNFTFMTTFPRKVYTEEDMEKPLSALGLVPSAVIMVTKQ